MAQLILPQRYLSQPQYHVEIAPEYADAEVLALFNTVEWIDLAGKHGFVSTVPPAEAVKQHGRTQQYGDVLGTHIKTSNFIPALPKFTAMAWVRPGTMGSGYKRILETNYSVNFYLGSSNTGNQYNFIVANSSLSACVGGNQVVGQRDFVAGVYNGTHCILYVNGREVARTTASAPYVARALCIGANEGNTNSGEHWVGDIDTVSVFPRAFSADQLLSLHQDPYQLVRPIQRRIYFTPSAPATDATGTASGTSTASGVGASTFESTGSSAGTSTVSGVGSSGSAASATGSASGLATVAGTGAALSESSGSAQGASTASGQGVAEISATGAAAGTSTVTGVGTSETGSSGTAAGTSTANASGSSVAASSGSVNGVASVTGIGASVAAAIGSASGTSTVSGVGDSVVPGAATGTASGTSTVSGVGASVAAATGTASGESAVTGKSVPVVVESDSFGGGYLYISREEHAERKKKQRIALGIIEPEKLEQFEISNLTEKRQTVKKKLIPARQQKKMDQEALNLELKALIQQEAEREEEIILRMLMEL